MTSRVTSRVTSQVTSGATVREAVQAPRPSLVRGTGIMLASALSNQVGAALGARAFGTIGPAGVVAVRQLVAALVLLPLARPPLRRMTWPQWWPVLLLAVVFGCMNLSLYTAIDRLGLGLAVTLEFLGPLAVALAASRSRSDLLLAAAAAAGVYVLVLPGPSSDWPGLALGLVAAACWAGYIVLNRIAGARMPGLQAPAVAALLCALGYLPVLVVLVLDGRFTATALGYAVVAGVLASVVPYAADLTALRFVPARFFGVFMSVHPVLAALVGVVLLGQLLHPHEWLGIAMVVATNAVAVTLTGGAVTSPVEVDPAAPMPAADQPTAPQPTAPQPTAPQPTAPQPTAPQPTAPQPT
ncbi:EamA family transporter [Blastococcus haudaquaticus]|uniref:EamA family transporter n=1 Tax=Blastococcus haudaquaticus TaxID=1938745 RepID=UPI00190E7CAF|nr:EamA family transporter [Blastococcus haudaquaticus]